MHRSILRPQQWTTTGYVCLRCRHQWANAERQNITQTRQASASAATTTTPPAPNDSDGTWFANFNDLSGGLSPSQSNDAKPVPKRGTRDVLEAPSAPSRGRKEALVRKKEAKAEAEDKSQRRARPRAKGRGAHARERHEQRDPLARLIMTPDYVPSKAFRRVNIDAQGERSIEQQKSVDGGGGENVMRSQFEKLVSALAIEWPDRLQNIDKQPSANLGSQPQSQVTSLSEIPIPPEADEVESSPGPATWQEAMGQQIEAQEPMSREIVDQEAVEAFPETAKSIRRIPSRLTAFSAAHKPVSRSARALEAQDRPQWGGIGLSGLPSDRAAKASYDKLRQWDLVSPKPVVTIAGQLAAWGVEAEPIPNSRDSPETSPAFATSPGDIADASILTDDGPTLSSLEGPADASKPNVFVQGYKALKTSFASSRLFGRRNMPDARIETRPTETEASGLNIRTHSSTSILPESARASASRNYLIAKRAKESQNGAIEPQDRPSAMRERSDVPRDDAGLANEVLMGPTAAAEDAPNSASGRLATLYHERETADAISDLSLPNKSPEGTEARLPPKGRKSAVRNWAPKNLRLDDRSTAAKTNDDAQDETIEVSKASHTSAATHSATVVEINAPDGNAVEEPEHELEDMSTLMSAVETGKVDTQPPPPANETALGDVYSLNPQELRIDPLDIKQLPVPNLQYGLDRVLFNPGVYQLQDPHSRVYNFDPYLQKIMPVVDFDYNALKEYKTSSEDPVLSTLAQETGKKYIGSTSSMTSTLAHFHYLLSNFRPINTNMMSKGFSENVTTFTKINRAPTAVFLRWKNGTYAIDADKEFDSANVFMMLGKSMEKLLTATKSDFERYRKSDPRQVSEAERQEPETYQYTTMGDFLMRSQLDAYDSRLPGTGTFDLKTRAVVSVRMNSSDHEPMTGYEIQTLQGRFESYEREYYDMMRSTMLKYMLQARMGRMDGIFVAYHNVERIFGFQYLPIAEIDRALHGQIDACLGDQEFKISLHLLNQVIEKATKRFPERSLRFHFEAIPSDPAAHLLVFAEPMDEDEIDRIQATSKEKVAEFERTMLGMKKPDIAPAASAISESKKSTSVSGSKSIESAQSSEAVKLSSTGTAADVDFIESAHSIPIEATKPLFAATIILNNYVKSQNQPETAYKHCNENRPSDLKRTQDWRVTYALTDAPMSPEQAWARYEDMKTTRRMTFADWDVVGEEGENAGEPKKEENSYIRFLKELSAKGRVFRGKLDQFEGGGEKVVFGQSMLDEAPMEKMDKGDETSAGSVDGYMRWLYKRDGD